MRYLEFKIENYRAITGPLTLDINKNPLIPIIGINECGKTTILHAIFAFDWLNDDLNRGRHLRDVSNLYALSSEDPKISATIELSYSEFMRSLRNVKAKASKNQYDDYYSSILVSDFPKQLTITRNLRTKKYYINDDSLPHKQLNNLLARNLLGYMTYILYFDDFRDSVDEEIEIDKSQKYNATGWLSIIEQLFKKTDSNLSVFDLPGMELRKRKSVIAKVCRKLNSTLTREWQHFNLEDQECLNIFIDFEQSDTQNTKGKIKLEVIEKDKNGDEHYFFVRDRSKGFFWFFNFVMKLEFNPKVTGTSGYEAIYLLDEPGSYLHASAQRKLCRKLRDLSKDNRVLYCTHSQYLLDPNIIPFNSIKIAEKDGGGKITLSSIHDYRGAFNIKNTTFQPLMDALQVNPFILDFHTDKVLIVEGITDRYAIELLKQDLDVKILPAVNADSAIYLVSLMIAWNVNYRVLWDNDEEGRKSRDKASKFFGSLEADERFSLLPATNKSGKVILQDLFCGDDIAMIKDKLQLPTNTSFSKVMATLFYSDGKEKIVKQISIETKGKFIDVLDYLGF